MHSQPFFPKGEVALSLFGEGPAEINRHDLVDFGIALVYIVKDTLLLINSPSFAKFTSIFPRCASATVSTLIVIFLLSLKRLFLMKEVKAFPDRKIITLLTFDSLFPSLRH